MFLFPLRRIITQTPALITASIIRPEMDTPTRTPNGSSVGVRFAALTVVCKSGLVTGVVAYEGSEMFSREQAWPGGLDVDAQT